MPKRIVTEDGSRFWITEYELPSLEANEVQIRVQLAAPKHGTEAQLISGSAFSAKQWNPELRLFLPRPESSESEPAPTTTPSVRGIGNMVVGEVVAVGSGVTKFTVGERVFGYGQVREVLNIPEDKLFALGALTESDAVCCDPAHVAFVAVRDGNIRIGDDVAVFGLGAIGLLAVQIARAGGARRVFAVDPLAPRREHALAHGATAVFDPLACDAALEIKLATEKLGVDVAIETSGSGRALNDSIRCVRQCGTVVHVPWGPKDASALKLGEEFHHNRPTIVGSQAWVGWGNPDRSHPLWNHERAYQATVQLFREGKLTGEGIVTPIVAFDDAPDVLPTIFTAPEKSIKIGVRLG
jgi:threonine dehydrogenase-like Zn-dependent dehydrogenase